MKADNKVNFYRSEMQTLREYADKNDIGKPNQKLLEALYEHIQDLKSKLEVKEKETLSFAKMAKAMFGISSAVDAARHLEQKMVRLEIVLNRNYDQILDAALRGELRFHKVEVKEKCPTCNGEGKRSPRMGKTTG